MQFKPTPLQGAFTIDLDKLGDNRGFFARMFCVEQFAQQGLETKFVQMNNSLSASAGTLRGMHYQINEAAEVKIVRCIQGALYDVIVDMRKESPTFGKHFGAELSADNRRMMYVPRGFAHGFITLQPDTEVIYMVSAAYNPSLERGLRFDDPQLDINWPTSPVEVSDKDRSWSLLSELNQESKI